MKTCWRSDELDSSDLPEHTPPYFDSTLDAWIVTRHQDVLAAFRIGSLDPIGATSTDATQPSQREALRIMREDSLAALTPAQLKAWQDPLAESADALAHSLSPVQPVELIAAYARPLCLLLASHITGIDLASAHSLRALAQPVSDAAAEPFDPALRGASKAAATQLRGCFHSATETLRDSGFIALSLTLPCLLANAWYSLLKHPRQWELLHQQPRLADGAIEELLRLAGLTRVVFRRASEDIALGEVTVRRGERLVLRLIAANRDPDFVAEPNSLRLDRRAGGHLALGSGPHSCVGASLIRMAARTITLPLVCRFSHAELAEPVEWQGGSGFRCPAALQVSLGLAQTPRWNAVS